MKTYTIVLCPFCTETVGGCFGFDLPYVNRNLGRLRSALSHVSHRPDWWNPGGIARTVLGHILRVSKPSCPEPRTHSSDNKHADSPVSSWMSANSRSTFDPIAVSAAPLWTWEREWETVRQSLLLWHTLPAQVWILTLNQRETRTCEWQSSARPLTALSPPGWNSAVWPRPLLLAPPTRAVILWKHFVFRVWKYKRRGVSGHGFMHTAPAYGCFLSLHVNVNAARKNFSAALEISSPCYSLISVLIH